MIDQLIHILIQSSWQILVLSIIVWPLSRLSIKAYPNFAYILWVVILIKALIPINVTLPSQQIPVVLLSPVITGQFIQETTVFSTSRISVNTILATLWSLGVLFLGMKLFLSEYAHRKRMRMAQELIPETWFEDLKTNLGLKRQIHLYMSEKIQSPLMQGLWNVRIYLPQEYQSWTRDEKQSVLAHELTHVRRLDILIIYLQAMVKTLYFFHPVIWLVNDQIDLEREKICDDEAIELSRTDRGAYGEQLFRQLSSEKGKRTVPVLAGGFFMSDSSIIKRFRYIKEKRGDMKGKLKFYHILLILVVISLAVIVACSQDTENVINTSNSIANGSGEFVINGLIWDREKPYAIINEDIYGEGAEIEGYTVSSISKSRIVLIKGEEVLHLEIQREQEATEVPTETPPRLEDNVIIATFDVPPEPVGGYAAVQENVHYPELARETGIGGTTIVQVTISAQGKAEASIVLKSAGDASLDSAALDAVMATEWLPAQQDGSPVAVRIAMPIVFRLKVGGEGHSITTANTIGTRDWDVSPRPKNFKAISQNIIYPEQARKDGITGTLTMQFTIDKKGNLIDPIVKSGPDHEALKQAAIVALKSTEWIPASKGGEPISATMEMGIGFELDAEKSVDAGVGLRPVDVLQKIPIKIGGPDAREKATKIYYEFYINDQGEFEAVRGSNTNSEEWVAVNYSVLDKWMKTKWVAVPEGAELKAQWVKIPLDITFID